VDPKPIFIDSGKGGLPYYDLFQKRNPHAGAVYIADTAHFPYGKKTKAERVHILCGLVEELGRRYTPALVALVCNTASVSALAELRSAFPLIPFVGTVPAVKPAIINSVSGIVGVLGTELTIDDPYIDRIAAEAAARAGITCRFERLAAPELVAFVEHRIDTASAQERAEQVRPVIAYFRAKKADGVVLGCTHFLLLKKDFMQEAAPDIRIYDSLEGVVRQIEHIIRSRPMSALLSVSNKPCLSC
jgi:glutamate racemase